MIVCLRCGAEGHYQDVCKEPSAGRATCVFDRERRVLVWLDQSRNHFDSRPVHSDKAPKLVLGRGGKEGT
jgi:hypothetical protein